MMSSRKQKLKEDIEAVKTQYGKEGSYLKGLVWEEDNLTFTFEADAQRRVMFTLCPGDDYPENVMLYPSDSDPLVLSGRLPALLKEVFKKYCSKFSLPPPKEDAPLKRSTDARPKLKQSTDSTASDLEEAEDMSISDNSEDEAEGQKHPELVRDLASVQTFFGSEAISTRDFPLIGMVDVELHLNLQGILEETYAEAWGVDLHCPLTIRLGMSSTHYLYSLHPPKIEVFQTTKPKLALGMQIASILRAFCQETYWNRNPARRPSNNPTPVPATATTTTTPAKSSKSKNSSATASSEEPITPDVFQLMEMGFAEDAAREALRQSKGKLDEAIEILTMHPEKCIPAKKGSQGLLGRLTSALIGTGKASDGTDEYDAEEQARIREFSPEWVELEKQSNAQKRRIPANHAGFFVQVLEYVAWRIPTLADFCVICDRSHVFATGAMLKPAVCSRELCCFSFQQLGVMSGAAEDIATDAGVVDLLICMAKAAVNSSRKELIFEPYPTLFDPVDPKRVVVSPKSKDWSLVSAIMQHLPSIQQMASAEDRAEMKKRLDRAHPLAYPMLQWIVSSNRSHVVKLPEHKHIKTLATPHQYLLLTSPPDKERKFRELKKKHGTTFAFHGSSVENWHSILRRGLLNCSGTKLQVNGAAYGNGVYCSPHAGTSFGYSRIGYNDPSTSNKESKTSKFLDTDSFYCVALCEVVNKDIRKSGTVWVVPDADCIVTRFFFVYRTGSVPTSATNASTENDAFVKEILAAMDRTK